MNTKFDSFISEMMGSEAPSEVSEMDIIRSIRQDLTKCSSRLANLKHSEAQEAMSKVDEARQILFDLQK